LCEPPLNQEGGAKGGGSGVVFVFWFFFFFFFRNRGKYKGGKTERGPGSKGRKRKIDSGRGLTGGEKAKPKSGRVREKRGGGDAGKSLASGR